MGTASIPRDSDGRSPAYAWPGGYQMVYITRDGLNICPACANSDHGSEDPVVAGDVYWEGPDLECEDTAGDGCIGTIPSAYGDPDSDS